MFEVGFTEIILILGLALLVLGPEKLPGLAQKVGRWTGRARSMARQLRAQLEQEVTMEEMAKSRTASASTHSQHDTSSAPPQAPETPAPDHTPHFSHDSEPHVSHDSAPQAPFGSHDAAAADSSASAPPEADPAKPHG